MKVWRKLSRGSDFVACNSKDWKPLDGQHTVEPGDTFVVPFGRSIGNAAEQINRMNNNVAATARRIASPLKLKRLAGTSEIYDVVEEN